MEMVKEGGESRALFSFLDCFRVEENRREKESWNFFGPVFISLSITLRPGISTAD